MADFTTHSLAVAFYLGIALSSFFLAITRDLITPIITGLIPGASQTLDKITIKVGPVTLSIGDAIAATLNLIIAFLVVSLTLPYINVVASNIGGRR